MHKRQLNAEETKLIYDQINNDRSLEPFRIEREKMATLLYYKFNDKEYALMYDCSCDHFCNVVYEGQYL